MSPPTLLDIKKNSKLQIFFFNFLSINNTYFITYKTKLGIKNNSLYIFDKIGYNTDFGENFEIISF